MPASVPIHERAEEDLRFIRRAMERSGTFTAVPGLGGAAMGLVGIAAAVIGSLQPTAERWLATWLAAAVVAFAIGLVSMLRKAARGGVPITGAVGRRFALSLAAPLAAGAALTAGVAMAGHWALMPSVWLLLYGTGVVTGGTLSVPAVAVAGLCFMLVGVAALITPAEWGNLWLGVGFGVVHLVFGLYVARKHGG